MNDSAQEAHPRTNTSKHPSNVTLILISTIFFFRFCLSIRFRHFICLNRRPIRGNTDRIVCRDSFPIRFACQFGALSHTRPDTKTTNKKYVYFKAMPANFDCDSIISRESRAQQKQKKLFKTDRNMRSRARIHECRRTFNVKIKILAVTRHEAVAILNI